MPTSNSSYCQLFQLHIDAYLDHELEPARLAEFQAHAGSCASCRRELAYAEQLHRAVVSLPILDCPDTALEPVDRLFSTGGNRSGSPVTHRAPGLLSALAGWLQAVPRPLRLAGPVLATVLVGIGIGRALWAPQTGPELAVQAPVQEQETEYTQAEIVQAMQDLELALDYLERISERTEVMIEDRFLRRQLRESINASLDAEPRRRGDTAAGNGPI